MDILQSLAYGFSVALTPQNLFYCFLGTVLGTAVGVLPGLGTITGVAILIPATLGMHPTSALIMLAGIYYGAQYGGSTTAIRMNLPGESTAVMTCLDGHQLARQGRAGQALGMAAMPSALPACPWRAIAWPSRAVTTALDSPGMLSRIDAVEPPYWAP